MRDGIVFLKGMRKIPRVSWTVKKTNQWILNTAGMEMELLDTVKARKLAYYGHTMSKQLERDNARNSARCTQVRKTTHTAWMDNIKTWTGTARGSQSEINGETTSMVWPILGSRTAKERNRTVFGGVQVRRPWG